MTPNDPLRQGSARANGCLSVPGQTGLPDEQAMVAEFHRKFDIVLSDEPALPDEATRELRVRLIDEEFGELKEALAKQDLVGIAKELADLLYVVYGTALSYGIDMGPVFREVHRSNLSKVGGYKRADGKWVKPPTYSPAKLEPILAAQSANGAGSGRPHPTEDE